MLFVHKDIRGIEMSSSLLENERVLSIFTLRTGREDRVNCEPMEFLKSLDRGNFDFNVFPVEFFLVQEKE